jgi:hypothetical protein
VRGSTVERPGVWPSLHHMVVPDDKKAEQNEERLIVMFEKQSSKYKWLMNTYEVSEETPYAFRSADAFNCNPNRGKTGKSLFIVNHWINPGGLPDPVRAGKTNSAATLTARAQDCIAARQKLPTTFAVNFTVSGDLISTVNRLNAAVARDGRHGGDRRRRRTPSAVGTDAQRAQGHQRAEADSPKIGEKKAQALLGPLVGSLAPPKGLDRLVTPADESDTQHR